MKWQAVYSLAPQGSDIVISGVEIRPRMPPGVLPPGGLTTRLTRTLRPPVALRLFRDVLAEFLTPGTAAYRSQATVLRFLVAGALKEQLMSGAITPETAAAAMKFLAADEPAWQDWLRRHSERWTGWGAALDELGSASRRDRLAIASGVSPRPPRFTSRRWPTTIRRRTVALQRSRVERPRRSGTIYARPVAPSS